MYYSSTNICLWCILNVEKHMKKTVGVVHGGLSHERDKSLLYGKHVEKILEMVGFDVVSLHLHPNGSWTVGGEIKNIEESLKKVDAVWNCLVGVDGENGEIEHLCQKCKTKILGHGTLHTHLASDKKKMQYALNQHGIKTPYGKVIHKKDYSKEKLLSAFGTVGIPAIVKPLSSSGVWGVTIVNNFAQLENAVEYLLSIDMDVLVEKVVPGTHVSCFVLEHNDLMHTTIKVSEPSAKLSREDYIKVRNEALYIHNALAFPHHVEYDFILSPKGLYFLEANTHPSLVEGYIRQAFKEGPVNLKEYISGKVRE